MIRPLLRTDPAHPPDAAPHVSVLQRVLMVLRLSTRSLAARLLGAALLVSAAAGCAPPAPPSPRLVVLGFSGLDPRLVERWIEEGKLPNMAALADRGSLHRLATTPVTEPAAAWTSLITGVNPGRHGIFGSVERDPSAYAVDLPFARPEPGRFLFGAFPLAGARYVGRGDGTPFWERLAPVRARSAILAVPFTFPPPADAHGVALLSGMPLPDLLGTAGTYQYFATDLPRELAGRSPAGGLRSRLAFDDDVARTQLVGPADPTIASRLADLRAHAGPLTPEAAARLAGLEAREHLHVPLTIRWNRGAPQAPSVTIELLRHSLLLRPGEWSRWIEVEFRAGPVARLTGLVQILLLSAEPDLRLYVTPINWSPAAPPAPISSPRSFAGDVYERLGPFRTLGWSEATAARLDGIFDERTFLDDVYRAFDDRAQVILSRLDAHDWNLLVGAIGTPARVQHVMWHLSDPGHPLYDPALARRFGDAIERVYRRCDQFVGEVLDRLAPGTPLLVLSETAFHAWRTSVHLNTWLAGEGLLALEAFSEPGPSPGPDAPSGPFIAPVDWTRTRAYALGPSGIHVNLRGRERDGIVAPGLEYDELLEELTRRLTALEDPATGRRVVRSVHRRDAVLAGPHVERAPDLLVGFDDGYRVSWGSQRGAAPETVFEANLSGWSGDASGFDSGESAGVLISSRRVDVDVPSLLDIAPTVLQYFGVPVPEELEGRPLY